jgi:SAM-dependent methyltransferase
MATSVVLLCGSMNHGAVFSLSRAPASTVVRSARGKRAIVRVMADDRSGLADNPDQMRWNARYGGGFTASFEPHPLAVLALSLPLPAGPVLDLACGPSGSALLAAASGHEVVAVDASDVALDLLGRQASRRGLSAMISLVHADLRVWRPGPSRYSVVLCTGYWDRQLFGAAAAAVAPRGLLAWEAFTTRALSARPGLPAQWCLRAGEPAALLPAGYDVVSQADLPGDGAGEKRRMLARRLALAG